MAKKRNPIVAIVGRPNVGKSTLFNAIAGEKISIVEDTPGVTRDRIYADCSWLNHDFTLIDTGGIEPDTGDIILAKMREQAEIAIEMADVIIFLVDVKSGVQDADQKVCEMLRRSGKPIVLTVNKVDKPTAQIADVYEFYNLGIGDPFPVSSVNKMGLGDLLEEVAKHFPEGDSADVEDDAVRVAIIGKPNVGKSSIVNRLIGEDRVIVSDIAGTTRDAIDTRVKHDGREYVFIDTAGLRRRNKITEDLERYMIIRAVAAVDRADIALLVINAQEGVTEQDAKIAGIAHDKGKAVIVAVNKWDAVEKDNSTMKKFTDKIHQILSFIPYAEIIYISALTGQRMNKIYDEVDLVHANQSMRIQTGVLNEIITEAAVMQQPPQDKGKMLKIYYATQSGVKPPTFVLFVNYRYLMHFSYQRYIENQIRETFGFRGTPLRFIIRERNEDK
ncbi:MAG TPA: ribosome biogenesis GTPase Der [Lachnospiraceae bacterium]|jgi:GTP-binding protein|nr:ribosome biogenesis GTPase Der [Lachnospiraceae bacterium]HAK18574.1 ribosome biogenesis GTPase Der [Lachnospiraceae bacterium]HAP72960.1 ribosome biogenesis GTPase Der [Lachnospiraceae bacterium]HBH70354.1 ribosome biogenesis GTPase Der [Lachnospiraceae bacterium]